MTGSESANNSAGCV